MHETPFDDDKLHEECGVFAIYGHEEAANLAYLGLYALQHRGQESAGIASSDGRQLICHKAMGHVADIFTPERLAALPGHMAIGHTRYSTTGDSKMLNAQPFSVACNKGLIAVAHNGNITNAAELRRELEAEGSIFQASSDTEVILHLVAKSRERTLAGALREALLQLEGAFSLVFLAKDRIIVARDPHGFRPLAMGKMEISHHKIGYVFASETCAFDLVNAVYQTDVEPGEMVIVGPEGVTREQWAPRRNKAHCVFEHVYFARPDSLVFGRPVQKSRERMGRLLAIEHPADADIVVADPECSRQHAAIEGLDANHRQRPVERAISMAAVAGNIRVRAMTGEDARRNRPGRSPVDGADAGRLEPVEIGRVRLGPATPDH
jgi:amidophosphoribosyltransferase